MTPEMCIKIFRKISDEDITFMGFSPQWSRPEWMICQTFAVPPPSVRPSVKHDSQQRSEDDLTHIIINIIKYNNTLREKLSIKGVNSKVIDDWTSILQYYIATMVDNTLPGASPVTQRSGRALKSITERHKGKIGRVRGNLMGKRVDFSARSVITPDPELSITELGVPMKIAMNITKPVFVNETNIHFLTYLVKQGPDLYPGAKILEKENGDNISLRYVDRENIKLKVGDTVHRHMLDGDYVLFNRQPTLHRMSMMAHIVRVMRKGDTFRMNVADTKPYNADFDGDEMNMHMPQNDEAEMELKHLAAIKYQIISPANNKSIIGIFQDSLLGAYLFTRPNIKFGRKEAMNLLMMFNRINTNTLKKKRNERVSNFEILSLVSNPFCLPSQCHLGISKSFIGGKVLIIRK
jgi:DNA-directed RNA polymerase II subunit RPB1